MSSTSNGACAQARRDADTCIGHPDPAGAAELARRDAMDLITDIRDLDPREVWGRLERWTRDDPARLHAATVVLAAMCNPDLPVGRALAWTDQLVSWQGAA